MLKSIITVVCRTVFSVAVLLLLLPLLGTPGGGAREIDAKREDGGDVQLQLKQQQKLRHRLRNKDNRTKGGMTDVNAKESQAPQTAQRQNERCGH